MLTISYRTGLSLCFKYHVTVYRVFFQLICHGMSKNNEYNSEYKKAQRKIDLITIIIISIYFN